jgi:cytidylate kinase
MAHSFSISEHAHPILGALRSVPIHPQIGDDAPRAVPFVTISREVGAGARTLAQRLCEIFNQGEPGETTEQQPWTSWDRELVEKVAADFHLRTRLIESLEQEKHSWIEDLLGSLSFDSSNETEMAVFTKVATTIRALAQSGRVIIVGLGGVFLTRKMPGGVHVQLVAPLEARIQHMMKQLNLPHDQAARRVHELSKLRTAFHKRFWPGEALDPELFDVTLNTAVVSQETCAQIIARLVKDVIRQPVGAPAAR